MDTSVIVWVRGDVSTMVDETTGSFLRGLRGRLVEVLSVYP